MQVTPRSQLDDTALTPHTLSVDGIRVRYVRAGQGETVLLLHGMMGAWSHWEPVIAPLAACAEVIALDLPPFGHADKPPLLYSLQFYADFLTRFVRELGVARVTLVGHSFGGKIASYVAATCPEWVSRLVLVSSDGYLEHPAHYGTWASEPLMRGMTRLVGRYLPWFVRRVIPAQVAVPEAMMADTTAFFADPATPRALVAIGKSADMLDLPSSDAAARLAVLPMPVLILHGTADRTVDPGDARRAAALLPRAELVWLAGVGHLPMLECPERVVEELCRFVAANG